MTNLILPIVNANQFDDLFDHVKSHKPRYQNMHLREARIVKGQRCLRYLHIIRAPKKDILEGSISGPNINVHYELIRGKSKVSVRFHIVLGSDQELKRLQKNFLKELLKRMDFEKQGQQHFPKRKKKQFYLKRARPGTKLTHWKSQLALSSGELSKQFLQKLEDWNFQLIYKLN